LKRSLNRVLDVRNLCTSLPVSRKHLLLHVLPSPQTQSGIPSRKPQTRPEKPKTHKTVKRSPIIAHRSHGKLERRHTDGLIHRTKPNRPHISSRYNSFKERTNKTPDAAPLLSARPPVICSCFPPRTVRRFVREPLTTKGIAGAQEVFYRNVIFPTRFLWAVGAPAPASRTNPARSHGKAGSPPGKAAACCGGKGCRRSLRTGCRPALQCWFLRPPALRGRTAGHGSGVRGPSCSLHIYRPVSPEKRR